MGGGTFFFALTLADRRSTALVDYIAVSRAAFCTTRDERPFAIDAIVILPDHLHAILTRPPDDDDFPPLGWRAHQGIFQYPIVTAPGHLVYPSPAVASVGVLSRERER
jgi:putative transposase